MLPLLLTVPAWAQDADMVKAVGNQFAKEISLPQRHPSPDTPRPRGRKIVYFYTGNGCTLITPEQLNKYMENVFKTVKALALDNKLYKAGPFGDTGIGPEVPAYVPFAKSFGNMDLLFK